MALYKLYGDEIAAKLGYATTPVEHKLARIRKKLQEQITMSEEPANRDSPHPKSLNRQFASVCDGFEDAWRAGQRPRIEDILIAVPGTKRGDLVHELLLIELNWRQRKGERPTAEEYRRRFPELGSQMEAAFARAIGSPLTEIGDQGMDSTLTRALALHIRCPHCGNAIELVEEHPQTELTCLSCGSKFNLAAEETVDYGAGEASPHRPKTVGHFELIETLGSGGFGTVWKACDTKLDRIVAVKIPRKGQLNREGVEKFLREARAAAQLQHPHIVGVHEVGLEGDLLYIVSDFIGGLSLDKWLAGQKLTHRESAELCVKIAEALHYAHEHGIIHRDLKPSNIMIDRAGEPHLMDFGLAKREAGEITMTMEGQILGTPAYMSPEQAKGEGHKADRRADVYSLGVVLFELLTGERPFRGNARMLIRQVIEDDAPRVRALDARMPCDLETIVSKCLEKEPARRYRTAAEVAIELQHWLRGEPIRARPMGRSARFWWWCRRNPLVAGLSAAAAMLLLAVAGVASIGYFLTGRALEREVYQRGLADAREQRARTAEHEAQLAQQRESEQRQAAEIGETEARRRLLELLIEQSFSILDREGAGRGTIWLAKCMTEASRLQATDLEEYLRIQLGMWYATVHCLVSISEHPLPVTHLCLACDGETLASLCRGERVVRLWNWKSTKEAERLSGFPTGVDSIAFHPKRMLLAVAASKSVQLWDVTSKRPTGPPMAHKSTVRAMSFSPDGDWLATGDFNGELRLWSVETGQLVAEPTRHTGVVHIVAFTCDGRLLLSGSDDRTVRVWEVALKQSAGGPLVFDRDIWSLAAHPNDPTIVAVGDGVGRVYLADLKQRKQRETTLMGNGAVETLAFDRGGKLLLAGFETGRSALLWDVGAEESFGAPLEHSGEVACGLFLPDGQHVVTGGDRCVKMWRVARQQRQLLLHQAPVMSVAFNPDGTRAATACLDGSTKLWAFNGEVPSETTLSPQASAELVAFSPGGKKLLVAGSGGARLYDMSTTQPVYATIRHDTPVIAAAFSPDGQMLVTGAGFRLLPGFPGGGARRWQISDGSPIDPPLIAGQITFSVAFAPDGKHILTTHADGTARLWDAASGRLVTEPLRHQGFVFAGSFSPDGRLIVTGGADRTARLWDAHTGQPQGSPMRHRLYVMGARFNKAGDRVLTFSQDGTVRVWAVATGQPVSKPLRHETGVRDACFSPDGRMVLTCSGDGKRGVVRLWHSSTGYPLGPEIRRAKFFSSAAFSSGHALFLAGSGDGTASLVRLPGPFAAKSDQVMRIVQLSTGLTLDEDRFMVMDYAAWKKLGQQAAPTAAK